MKRSEILNSFEIQNQEIWDVVVIGGGATGLGVAIDSACRGYKTLLLEQSDFAKSTSSKSTKLVHGGVRYMAQGYIDLVKEACKERGLLLKNAPHLTKNMTFVIPIYTWLDRWMYTIGLKFYDFLAGKLSLGKSHFINKEKTIQHLPTVKKQGLKGGVVYHDGQFDDARLALNLAQTAIEKGATVLNYAKVTALSKDEHQQLNGLRFHDEISKKNYEVRAKAIVNATGVFADTINRMDHGTDKKTISPSQGIHLMIDKKFCPTDSAIMIPKTEDGRVLFAVPWHNKIILGTTDTPVKHESLEPKASEKEIDFILDTAKNYLQPAPTRADIESVFAGLRPLAAAEEGQKTKEVSRSHKLIVAPSRLVSIIGGKWTTYRKMAEDTMDRIEEVMQWKKINSNTEHLKIHGYREGVSQTDELYFYGSDEEPLKKLAAETSYGNEYLSPSLGIRKIQVVWAVRKEMAVHVEDVLARRTRALLLDQEEAVRIAPEVAKIMAEELHKDQTWIDAELEHFNHVASIYH
ncbi:glycerol-3-phosphate dehydrogenase/oxidase [Riemerella columbina]|nr:glycerol-3-phosphate dehydrogenase/oxidase [Riemerella columbina]WKS96145.1 glycerol-3-phosphate dehydrogenase/oxidase [Riemerella columbina]